MKPARVPLSPLPVEGVCELPTEAGHYITHVLRRARGDELILFDPALGLELDAQILSVSGALVLAAIGPSRARASGAREVSLLQALGKGDKLDAVVRDATELGVTRIAPVISERTVVRPGDRAQNKLDRWVKIAVDAARQCGRSQAPLIEPIRPLREAAAAGADLRLVLTPSGGQAAGPLLLGEAGSVAFAVGPEGGFSASEIEALEAGGWVAASLGPLVLRTETVAAAVLGALLLSSPPAR